MGALSFVEKRVEGLNVDDFEIYSVISQSALAQAKEGEIEFSETSREKGLALRLFKKGHVGFSCTSDLSESALTKVVQWAHQSLSLIGAHVAPSTSQAGGASPSTPLRGWFPPSPIPDFSSKQEMALALEATATQFDPRIRRVRDARFAEENRQVFLKNSRGFEGESNWHMGELSLMVVAEKEGEQQMAWEELSGPSLTLGDAQKVARVACEKALSQLGASSIKTQKAPALLDPVVVSSFLGVLSSSFLGDQVQKNRSSLKGKLGQGIYADHVSIIDDGSLPGGYMTSLFDGEGCLTRKNVVVQKGQLKMFLYDQVSGQKEGKPGSGNSIRPHWKESPRVGVTNFYLEGGLENFEDFFTQMGTGFWVRDVIGVHTADAVTGDFSLGASGVWIEKGKRSHPVRGVTISGNLHELFRKVVKIAQEVKYYRSYGAPGIWMSELDIGGK